MNSEINAGRCANHSNWKTKSRFVTIKPNETAWIGTHRFADNLSGWFNFLEIKKFV